MQTIDLLTTTGHAMINTPARQDIRPGVKHLSQEKLDRCIIDAALSSSAEGGLGSSCAAMIEYSETCYPEGPDGRGCGQN